MFRKKGLAVFIALFLISRFCSAQFIDDFEKEELEDWLYFTGDGNAEIDFVQEKESFATIYIDATNDQHNVWYAITKRNVAPYLNLKKLKGPDSELRVEARVRIKNPPKRVNIMVNTQRTTEFHHDLMEFELQDQDWHVISMTTNNLDAIPGDSLFIQFNVTDFGPGKYEVDVDYIKADIINTKKAGPDKGIQIPYHPAIPQLSSFSNKAEVAHDALINKEYPELNLNDWHVREKEGVFRVLTVNGNQWAILRWDLENFKDSEAKGAGILEITTQSVATGGNYVEVYEDQLAEEFPRVRVIEIFDGQEAWEQEEVTHNSFIQGKPYQEVFNTQMIYDFEVDKIPGGKNFITISQPVMQRLLNGTTKGLLIKPLGAIDASFYASENTKQAGKMKPKLYFNTVEE
ncbi:hypothetical protein [Autumnicola psychrophila]|uniref:Uncharacterized protein n=1 Tax=Autumnicola psychrophila TaxID=3075592 RepID=A0ABU3DSB7_9FLAO|nr:hypothetical protein [Zunongwangia sp. F225]MDT0686618.1 hypothetical protein [Zunongwangia sp. F225]